MLQRIRLLSALVAVSVLAVASMTHGAMVGTVSYIYDASFGEDGSALDGSWSHDNGSDAWDESKPDGSGSPGGAMVERENLSFLERPEVLAIVDTGDPRGAGFPDPGSNRKLFFTRDVPDLDFNAGAFVVARWRMDPDPPETNLDGSISDSYTLHDDKGQINLGNGSNSLSISYQSATELAVKLSDSDDFALIDVGSSFDFHTVLASMKDNSDGTFAVDVWVDGVASYSNAAAALLGNSELGGPGISMGVGSTGRAGAIQVDFIGAGTVPEPSSIGLILMGLIGTVVIRRRHR